MTQYDPPSNSGVPSPYGPRLHNWKGGRLNEGSLFHGPVYTRPDYLMPYRMRPLQGPEDEAPIEETNKASSLAVVLPLVVLGGFILALFTLDGDKK